MLQYEKVTSFKLKSYETDQNITIPHENVTNRIAKNVTSFFFKVTKWTKMLRYVIKML